MSYLSLANGVITNNLFENVNGFPLGDIAQSMMLHNNKGFIIVNNSQKVEVVNSNDFTSQHTIGGLQGPRYMVGKGNKGYISDWFSNSIAVVELNSNTISKNISTGNGPEQMAIVENVLFVTNVGGFGNDSTVSVINLLTEANVGTIQGGINPNSIQLDANGKLWVLCGGSTGPDYIGGTADDIAGSLWKINPLTFAIEQEFTMSSSTHPVKLQINGNRTDLFYLSGSDGYSGKIMKISANSSSFNAVPIINKDFYGLGIDPVSGVIYGAFVPGFSQNGYVFRYTIAATLVDSMLEGRSKLFCI
ncbi:MAG: hypothetical protein IPP71_16850 [Bacteroidetes bacterium]|nr:hypothetical protein [Bacteroidota bacterium]